ncbi:efflux RND transporter periplasmic adaptor subunit [Falsirhodobacter algicola]|uniref:Efflux RND transporter periplasmic adaptor subunit n=1 Tax=Falsirhodobacter algicola TaxID=2692330 RepID=A0A8J8SL02_9RHOB|nr:efflux RND transporter periplasmic adaptor subunit [Falsirhodobacter algicola]QUS36027.1 efflux RND transporter periplasmic adaptor subunit [Falsirhodobacter algicola]
MKARKLWIAALVMIAALGAGGYLWLKGTEEDAAPPASYAARRGDVTLNVLASGQVESSSLVSVGARVSGEVVELAVALGQEVRQGDLIARIDSQDQENAVAQAKASLAGIEAQIASAEASLTLAEQVRARSERLSKVGSLTVETFEQAVADAAIAAATVDELRASRDDAEIAVASAEVELERTRITAPMDGTVVAIVTKEGQTVNANQSAPTIVKLADLHNMVVNAEISEADVVRVAPGQNVSFTILGAPERTFHAVVRQIEPAPSDIEDSDDISTDEAIYYNGLFDVTNEDGVLRIGMTAEVQIALQSAEGVVTLPSAALGAKGRDGRYTVQVLKDGIAEPRRIEVGLNNNVVAEITDGLEEGERVLASGAAAGLARAVRTGNGPGGGPGGGGPRGPMGL